MSLEGVAETPTLRTKKDCQIDISSMIRDTQVSSKH